MTLSCGTLRGSLPSWARTRRNPFGSRLAGRKLLLQQRSQQSKRIVRRWLKAKPAPSSYTTTRISRQRVCVVLVFRSDGSELCVRS